MNNSKNYQHYFALIGLITLGAMLRFWHLDLKPLWLDEVLTALLSLGNRYEDVPLDVLFPASTLQHLFTLKSSVSCPEIAEAVATKSTHPPLFFCLMHQWLNWVEPLTQPLSWKLRSLPAILGVIAIALTYLLNRLAFSPAAGLMGAAVMAVSPFAVYLSQEARHYTLPMLFLILALLGLIQIQKALVSQKLPHPLLWIFWGIVNSIGCYIHYFFFIAFIAQVLTFISLILWRRRMLPRGSLLSLALVIIGVAASYLPWLPVMLGSFGRAETGWLPKPTILAPIYQTLATWLSIAIAFPVESQPLWVQIPSVLLSVSFGIWFARLACQGFKQLQPAIATFTLTSFTLFVLLQFAAIVYLLGKDITVAPRYNFVYYPAVCAILGACFAVNSTTTTNIVKNVNQSFSKKPVLPQLLKKHKQIIIILLFTLLSSLFVVNNLIFLKPFQPQKVAQNMNFEPTIPIIMVMGYNNFQDVALGLSFALAIEQKQESNNHNNTEPNFAFLNTKLGYEQVWANLSNLAILPTSRLNLWVVAPGLKQRNYPPKLMLKNKTRCLLDSSRYYRIGIPYQLYRCASAPKL
ncbi:MAG: glycosyltransferase family 39 protein [Coleofasciculaceae cyanobacterium]